MTLRANMTSSRMSIRFKAINRRASNHFSLIFDKFRYHDSVHLPKYTPKMKGTMKNIQLESDKHQTQIEAALHSDL